MYKCTHCGSDFTETSESQRYVFRKTGRIYCTKQCGKEANAASRRGPKAKPVPCNCSQCGDDMVATKPDQRARLKRGQRVYCSDVCRKEYMSQRSSETMAETNRKYASARMLARNPMSRPEIRQKVSDTHKRNGHGPKIRGGNGRPATEAERKLVEIFGPLGFVEQCIVKTGMHNRGYPSHYKIDCGNAALKIGIEADGRSHSLPERRKQDVKKDALLTSYGWAMFRFPNETILSEPDKVFETVLTAIMERH